MIDRCPKCESTGTFTYFDRGVILEYVGSIGRADSIECVQTLHTRPAPVFAKCDKCGKQIRIKDLRGD